MSTQDITVRCKPKPESLKTMLMKIRTYRGSVKLVDYGYDVRQEEEIYLNQLKDLLENTREYLDSLDYLPEYRVSWKEYKQRTATLPFAYTKSKRGKPL